jgi:hypothetical protein
MSIELNLTNDIIEVDFTTDNVIMLGGTTLGFNSIIANLTAVPNTVYLTNGIGVRTITLPTTMNVGDVIEIIGSDASSWRLNQNAGQKIRFGDQITTTGVTGYIESNNQYDHIRIVCVVANLDFRVIYCQGNLTVG